MQEKNKITVVGSGYVGMSISVLLAQHNDVIILDIDAERVKKINNNISTIADVDITKFLNQEKLFLSATLNANLAYKNADYIVIATPTDYDPKINCFNTTSVDMVVKEAIKNNKEALIIIKSTVPIGYTKSLQDKYSTDKIIFSPEFLQEGTALRDNLYPSRIILGGISKKIKSFADILQKGAKKKNIKKLFMPSTEAEAVKLFANSYLAMRISFFNELDSYSVCNNLDSLSIINGICLDPRIGQIYNNPSFGYGGYCLPKDTKQLLSNFDKVPQKIISAIVDSNKVRKDFIANEVIKIEPKIVGIYRLTMKKGSANFRSSAIIDIINLIQSKGIEVIVYEPLLDEKNFNDSQLIESLDSFKKLSNIIIANRMDDKLNDIKSKVYTRDLFRNG